MHISTRTMIGGLLLLLGTSPSFAQGVYATPPAPNSSQSMPQPPGSAPAGARTLAPGTTGIQHMGTLSTTLLGQEPAVFSNVRDSDRAQLPLLVDTAPGSNP